LFEVFPRFYPIRLIAGDSCVEMTVKIENKQEAPMWVECSIAVPEGISLAEKKQLSLGRIRVGIINSKECGEGRCKVFAMKKTAPGIYEIKLTAYGFSKDGNVIATEEKKTELRCEEMK